MRSRDMSVIDVKGFRGGQGGDFIWRQILSIEKRAGACQPEGPTEALGGAAASLPAPSQGARSPVSTCKKQPAEKMESE